MLLLLLLLQVLVDVIKRVEVQPRDYVIRQGDTGDRFYIIDSGVFEVRVLSPDEHQHHVSLVSCLTTGFQCHMYAHIRSVKTMNSQVHSLSEREGDSLCVCVQLCSALTATLADQQNLRMLGRDSSTASSSSQISCSTAITRRCSAHLASLLSFASMLALQCGVLA